MEDGARSNVVEFLVSKRCNNLSYLKKLHDPTAQTLWLNVVRVTPEDIIGFYDPATLQKRTEQWFHLGFSMAPLLNFPNGQQYVRALAQLMEEFEFHYASSTVQTMKILKAKSATTHNTYAEKEHVNPVLHKSGKTAVYEFLSTPNIPCQPDYRQVVFSLCELLALVYRKLFDYTSSAPALYDAILKFDSKIKHHIIGAVSKDMNQLAMTVLKNQVSSLHSLFQSDNMFPSLEMDDDDDKDQPTSKGSINQKRYPSTGDRATPVSPNPGSPTPTSPVPTSPLPGSLHSQSGALHSGSFGGI